jgi:beta-galactosidase
MEQQPGPVNWAPSNAQPLPNAPAFWGMEAIAHGAEFVSFFRFQQLPRAQEQMHGALRLPTGEAAPAWAAVEQLASDLAQLPQDTVTQAPIALLFDYPSCWVTAIQPHAPGTEHLDSAFQFYSAARMLGVDIDIVDTGADLTGYKLLIIPGTVIVDEAFVARALAADVSCLIGPRSGSRDRHCALPENLPPGPLQTLVPLRVTAVDSMRKGAFRPFSYAHTEHLVSRWHESVDTGLKPRIRCEDGASLWYQHGKHHYLNAWVAPDFLCVVLREMLEDAGVQSTADSDSLAPGLRLRRRGDLLFVFNFAPEAQNFTAANARCLAGDSMLAQGDYAIWQTNQDA